MSQENRGKINLGFASRENETIFVESRENSCIETDLSFHKISCFRSILTPVKQSCYNETKHEDCSLISVINTSRDPGSLSSCRISDSSSDVNFRNNSQLGSSIPMRPAISFNQRRIFNSGQSPIHINNSDLISKEFFKPFPISAKRNYVTSLVKYSLSFSLILLSIWAPLYVFWGEYAFPGDGPLFSLFILEISASLLGQIGTFAYLPKMTGMTVAGLILRNVPCINVANNLPLKLSSPLRGISVVVLLTRGAFNLNIDNIKKYKKVVPLLGIGPCLVEALFGGATSYFIIGFPLPWAALFGCIMSAMSGSAIVPYLNSLESSLYSNADNFHWDLQRKKDVIMIAKTASGVDAIISICMVECIFGFIFGEENLESGLLKGLTEVTLGSIFGVCWGCTTGLLLTDEIHSDLKIFAIFSAGVSSLIGLYRVGYPRGGPPAAYFGAFTSITLWKRQKSKDLILLTNAFDKLWLIFEPLLFGIIGARTDLTTVDWIIIYKGAICLGISILGRVSASYFMTSWADLEIRERLFLVVNWCGKGTVAAALGPVALDTALDFGYENFHVLLGTQIMNLAVLIILIYSLVGFIPVKIFGAKILCPRRTIV